MKISWENEKIITLQWKDWEWVEESVEEPLSVYVRKCDNTKAWENPQNIYGKSKLWEYSIETKTWMETFVWTHYEETMAMP